MSQGLCSRCVVIFIMLILHFQIDFGQRRAYDQRAIRHEQLGNEYKE